MFSKSIKLSFSLLQECINDICEKYINSYCSKKENKPIIENETKLIQFSPVWDSIFPMLCYVPVSMHSLFLGCFQPLLKLIKKSLFSEIV